jgi:putative heme-binding domain-containing protein
VEAVDGADDSDYSAMAFGGFSPAIPELRLSEPAPREWVDWMTAAAAIAVRVRMTEFAPVLASYCTPRAGFRLDEVDPDLVGECAAAWLALAPGEAVPGLSRALQAGGTPIAYREHVATLLASINNPEAQHAVIAAMKGFPQKIQERLAYPLASATFSAETLLAGMESGAVSPRVLQRVGVNNRLRVSKPTNWEARVAKLKTQFPPADDERDRLISNLRHACSETVGHAGQGRLVFAKYCAVCHRLGSEGALIGPQLDGIGQRGLDRLCEDVLDPNRNVDRAFRTSLITLKNGEVMSGLFRREEGQLVVLADSAGKEVTVSKARIAERHESETSLMPENFGEALSREDFVNLMALLLSTAAPPAQK